MSDTTQAQAQTQARPPPKYTTALLSGALAGFSVDISLFPLDTLKTRAQSAQGFWAAGGFKGVYNGLSSVAAGSAPGAAIFFLTYESLKPALSSSSASLPPALTHMLSASLAETAACLVRVPTEVIKSRMQAGTYKGQSIGRRADGSVGLLDVVRTIAAREGVRGFWKGFGTTVAREIPFTCIQFPLYERLKLILLQRHNAHLSTPAKSLPTYQAALVGSFAGGIAAALTTPLDVVKTRLMLVERKAVAQGSTIAQAAAADTLAPGVNQKFLPTLGHIYKTQGIKGLFKGVVPRTIWISLGGAVFLGSFELGVQMLDG